LFAKARASVASPTNSPLAPYTTQAARTMLADLFARNGEQALLAADAAHAHLWLGAARSLLGTLTDAGQRATTLTWREQPGLTYRLARLDQLDNGALPNAAEFWFSDAYESAYACGACHAPSAR
jgi:hypothetical protein